MTSESQPLFPEPTPAAAPEGEAQTAPQEQADPMPISAPAIISPPAPSGGGGVWTIAFLCIGLAMIAACVLIPQADANRKLVYQRQKLILDLDQIQRQTAVNKDFLHRIESDPQLAERLVQRQLKMVREGETVLDVQPAASAAATDASRMSPFEILSVPAPSPLPAYEPLGGTLADFCRKIESQLWILGVGLFLVAAGLILGESKKAQPLT